MVLNIQDSDDGKCNEINRLRLLVLLGVCCRMKNVIAVVSNLKLYAGSACVLLEYVSAMGIENFKRVTLAVEKLSFFLNLKYASYEMSWKKERSNFRLLDGLIVWNKVTHFFVI